MLRRFVPPMLGCAALLAGLLATPAAAASTSVEYTGSLADGSTWVADVPSNYTGTTILYSHGFGPLLAQDAPDPTTKTDLLNLGYALVGSSYSGSSLWALDSAVDDQFGALAAFEHIIGPPARTIAWGTSMGGLISAEEAQHPRGQLAGALTTCGLVGGALNLDNYQLDGEYAIDQLLTSTHAIQLTDYTNAVESVTAATELSAAITANQTTAAGRARTALAAALFNEPGWFTGATPPAATDYAGQEAQQASELSSFVLPFIVPGRYQIEVADGGGDSSFNVGVNYAAILARSSFLPEVAALYRSAGLNLWSDLTALNGNESTQADPAAVASLARTSMVNGHLGVPELDIHTIADQLIPVEQENWYAAQVAKAGSAAQFRQAFVDATGHCNFTPTDTIAALHALERRLNTGQWGEAATPASLNASAAASGLGAGNYLPFHPPALANARTFPPNRR